MDAGHIEFDGSTSSALDFRPPLQACFVTPDQGFTVCVDRTRWDALDDVVDVGILFDPVSPIRRDPRFLRKRSAVGRDLAAGWHSIGH
jgi:hypothetical protein